MTTIEMPPPPLTVQELAERWRCSRAKVSKMIHEGVLRPITVSSPLAPVRSRHRKLVPWSEIQRLESLPPLPEVSPALPDPRSVGVDQTRGTSAGGKKGSRSASQRERLTE